MWGIWGCEPAPQGEIELSQTVVRRRSPSSASPVVDTLTAGVVVSRLREAEGWLYVCYRGIRGWIPWEEGQEESFLSGEPTEHSLLFAKTDSVAAEVTPDSGEPRYVRLGDLSPWFVSDSLSYAGFYEGLPGEDLGLVIVNFVPHLSLLVKVARMDPEAMEIQEEQIPMGPELSRVQNVILVEDPEAPFRRAEFVRLGSRVGLLLSVAPGQYVLLWRRIFS